MSMKKMMLVSFVATGCLSILSVVVILLVSQFESNDVKRAVKDVQAKNNEEVVEIEVPEELTTKEEFVSKGIRHYTDEYGIHDVFFEHETMEADYLGATGPIHIQVTNLKMERFYPNDGIGKVFAEGYKELTLVAVDLEVKNLSSEQAFFELKTVRGKADNGEVAKVETILSDDFDFVYEPDAKRRGTIYFMYQGKPDDIAMLTMDFTSAEDAQFKAIDKGVQVKVRLY